MPISSNGPGDIRAAGASPRRYIVRAAADADDVPGALGNFIDSLGADPAIRLIDTIGPSTGPPHTVVVETDPATVEQLRRRNHNQLTIEPDQPLSLFD